MNSITQPDGSPLTEEQLTKALRVIFGDYIDDQQQVPLEASQFRDAAKAIATHFGTLTQEQQAQILAIASEE